MQLTSRSGKQNPVVVIPIYKDIPTRMDIISIKRCFKILGSYPIVALIPHGFSLQNYPFNFFRIEQFDNIFFSDIQGYNKLMLSASFYERFMAFKFILVYQTDAYVFSDQLKYWCELNYDYVGAPWLYRDYPDKIKFLKEQIRGVFHRKFNILDPDTNMPTEIQFHNVVGNGGFSLRKVEKFFKLCQIFDEKIETYLKRNERQFNEDVFWSIEVNRNTNKLRVPNYKKALLFSIESEPDLAFSMTKGTLPFGCHGWNLPQTINIWRPIFESVGIQLNEKLQQIIV